MNMLVTSQPPIVILTRNEKEFAMRFVKDLVRNSGVHSGRIFRHKSAGSRLAAPACEFRRETDHLSAAGRRLEEFPGYYLARGV